MDDSTATLRAICTYTASDSANRHSWKKGISWVISMQNDDGGWPAFERNADNPLFSMIPGGDTFLIDPSSVDLTARTLEFFGSCTHADMEKRAFKGLFNGFFAARKTMAPGTTDGELTIFTGPGLR